MSQADDEYIDYSCSTPLERLARDVETILRSWHVSENDRHVSFDSNHPPQKEQKHHPHHRHHRHHHHHSHHHSQNSHDSNNRGVKLIRSSEVIFTTFEKETVHLSLSLWDAPSNNNNDNSQDDNNSILSEMLSSLPMSLRPKPTSTSFFCLSDLSALFGIGQHIVLTTTETKEHQTFSIQVEMMQMALNIATQNCYCSIPAFALPGEYKPTNWNAKDPIHVHVLPPVRNSTHGPAVSAVFSPPLMDIPSWLVPEKIVNYTKTDEWTTSLAEEWSNSLASLSNSSKHLFSRKGPKRVISTALIRLDEEESERPKKRQFFKSIFSGYCNPGPNWKDAGAYFVLEYIPTYIPSHLQTVEDLACLLRYYCQDMSERDEYTYTRGVQDDIVRLEHACYKYEWNKGNILLRQKSLRSYFDQVEYYNKYEWRTQNEEDFVCDIHDSYSTKCTEHAMSLLQSAHMCGKSSSKRDPIWGPSLDPLASIQLSISWLQPPKPISSILSTSFATRSISSSAPTHPPLFSPTQSPPSSFKGKCYWDRSIPCHTLSASTRCTLAAYLRACTLHRDLLLRQLSNTTVLEELSTECNDNDEMEDYAMALSEGLANLVTKKLVKAMDFRDSMELPEKEELEERVRLIFDANSYPSHLQEDMYQSDNEDNNEFSDQGLRLNRGAPPGRLLSLLSMHMTQMKTPARMAALWLVFLDELRLRWEMRETLPLLNPILGFDWMEDPKALKHSIGSGVAGTQKASLAAYNHHTERDPDHDYCLISQKLQVFNIGIETQLAAEKVWCSHQEQIREDEERRKLHGLPDTSMTDDDDTVQPSACYASTTTISENLHDIHSPTMNDNDSHSDSDSNEEFFDTVDTEEDTNFMSTPTIMEQTTEESIGVLQRQQRRGARCPVNNVNLIASGDQLFAPYLQRPLPLTEDVMVQRKLMMMRQGSSTQGQLIIAQRLQKPKLLSDMRAFKAANPGAVFQDFINWYGNPVSPFDGIFNDDDYEETDDNATMFTARTSRTGRSLGTLRSVETARISVGSIETASSDVTDAMEVLTATRTFWSDTWDEAEPSPASDQQPPLFDPSIEVEMVLNYFDTMHPSQLLNQVLSVNFTNANFILRATAGEALNVKTVRFALDRLDERTRFALDKLDEVLQVSMFDNGEFTTHEVLNACEAVCDAIGDVEVLLARAASLLHKFPGDFELVQKILRKRDGEEVPIQSFNGRVGVLKTVWKHQRPRTLKDNKVWANSVITKGINYYPEPTVQEYSLRNNCDENPFQLCAMMRENSASYSTHKKGYNKDGSILLAMKRCERE